MKILIAVSDSFCGNFIKGQPQFLKSMGHEVVIVSPEGQEILDVAGNEGAKLVSINFNREISLLSDIRNIFAIIKIIISEKPDIINAGNPKTGFLFAVVGFFFRKVPVIFTLRGLRSETLNGLKKQIVRITEVISCRLSDEVIVISPSLKERALELGLINKDKGIVIGKGSSNGFDVKYYTLSTKLMNQGFDFRLSLGLNENDILIGFVGRVTKDKGIYELYDAFKKINSQNPNLKLVLVGPIEINDSLGLKILAEIKKNDSVFLVGKMLDVRRVYSAIDMLVLYSYREGFGNVVLEAASMKCPAIVADIPGARDTVEHLKSGILVKPQSVLELSKAINYYLDNPELRVKHGDYGRKRVEDFFSSKLIWEGQLKLYTKLAGKKI